MVGRNVIVEVWVMKNQAGGNVIGRGLAGGSGADENEVI